MVHLDIQKLLLLLIVEELRRDMFSIITLDESQLHLFNACRIEGTKQKVNFGGPSELVLKTDS